MVSQKTLLKEKLSTSLRSVYFGHLVSLTMKNKVSGWGVTIVSVCVHFQVFLAHGQKMTTKNTLWLEMLDFT